MNFGDIKGFAPVVLRLGLSAVFLWFGINQLINTANFLGYLPQFMFSSPYASYFVVANGIFEIVASTMLALGLFVRPVALLLALHLAAITFEVGWSETGVRDFGLTLATLSIALGGPDRWCLQKPKR